MMRLPVERLTLTPLTPQQAADAAWLHRVGQPGSFLTALGDEVLTVLYRVLPQSRVGFGFAAIDPLQPQKLLGFVSATTSVAALFLEMGLRRFPDFAPALARRFIQEPTLALRATETVLYPFRHATSDAPSPTGELLSIMVKPELRSHGVGGMLLAALKAECLRRGVAIVDVTVAADNQGAQRFYVRHGFTYVQAFTLYGRPMHLYRALLLEKKTAA
ncbi:MAG: GNAT family N-acetyltransferase [Caldilinea sp.]|nr:GNAT family N-acetyltransferase [Caldilinea sp.]MDW8440597.1 GNAT family N-acetyltransferase [Caldilineaceae bacterium]